MLKFYKLIKKETKKCYIIKLFKNFKKVKKWTKINLVSINSTSDFQSERLHNCKQDKLNYPYKQN